MGKRLRNYVHVHVDGDTVVYGPDDEVPADHAKLIGDHAWIDEDDADYPDDRLGIVADPPKGAATASKGRRPARGRPAKDEDLPEGSVTAVDDDGDDDGTGEGADGGKPAGKK